MSQKKKQITIVLPSGMADMPVRVVRGNECSEIIVDIRPVDECLMPVEWEGRVILCPRNTAVGKLVS